MKTIWKYPIAIADRTNLMMPDGAEILTVQMQGESPVIWALVDDDMPNEERRFELHGTGNFIEELSKKYRRLYINSFQLYAGQLVYHLFEVVHVNFEVLD